MEWVESRKMCRSYKNNMGMETHTMIQQLCDGVLLKKDDVIQILR